MGRLLSLGGILVAVTLAACSGASPEADPSQALDTAVTPARKAKPKAKIVEVTGPHRSKLKVRIPPGPPPKKLIVKDLKLGSGPAIDDLKDVILVTYLTIDYRSANAFYNGWELGVPARFVLEETHRGWELGLQGMKAGGVRQLITPSRLEYGSGTLIFIIELMKMVPSES